MWTVRWPGPAPAASRSLAETGHHCLIWSIQDLPDLGVRELPEGRGFYCESEGATIQFLRSRISEHIITQGSIAIGTDQLEAVQAQGVERRYRSLRRFLKQVYANSIVRWYSPDTPFAPAAPGRSANPSLPDPQVWVGPSALARFRSDPGLRIRQFAGAGAFGFVSELPSGRAGSSRET